MSSGEAKRAAIIARDDSTCYLCHRKLELDEITIEHVIPRSRGGTNARSNLKVACERCNHIKGDRLLSECDASEFIHSEQPVKVGEEAQGKRERLRKANQRLFLVRVASNINTPQAVIERMVEAARKQ